MGYLEGLLGTFGFDRRGAAELEELERSSGPDPDRIEEIRIEVHGLKGAAMVIGEEHLGLLANQRRRSA